MKRIGLLGGMSWESSALYYSLINEGVRDRLGGLHSASCVLISVDFAQIERLQTQGEWQRAGEILAGEARRIEAAGADLLVLCTNTMHKVAAAIEDAVSIPFLHLGDVTARAVLAAGVRTVGLLGTRFTMEQAFYVDRLAAHGLEVLLPGPENQAVVNAIIYDELVLGDIRDESRRRYQAVMKDLVARGAGGIILGCTEIELLIGQDDSELPVFATTRLHAEAAVTAALAK
ncbi:aspartate/glutamate racemase family protein [Arthrobacter sp. MSA 4-2]|uniref:aspartate/glutamate racemase family protein n=1 Tax=Arthrobacter sp. MSA 4-2 TaxID=2794349 RepID=UPI0018E8390B|nr:aspartate/glutamate racemase family protein [Arthrobacter sp. MSA 4-2]MBJ2120116.1 aspartate/glutamate racemase family protein [Arthrobacter sp. MSA 4-2]